MFLFKGESKNSKAVIVAEMSCGQMLEDVKLGLEGTKSVSFVGEAGGVILPSREIYDEIVKLSKER